MTLIRSEIMGKVIDPEARKKLVIETQKDLASHKNLDRERLLELWAILGESYKYEKLPLEAEIAYSQVIDITTSLKDDHRSAEAYIAIGDAWVFVEDYEKGVKFYRKAADLSQNEGAEEWLKSMSQMAYAYSAIGNKAEEQNVLRILIETTNLPALQRGTILERLALSIGTTNPKEAIAIYEEALMIFEKENFKRYWEKRIRSLAQLYESIGDLNGAQKTLNRL